MIENVLPNIYTKISFSRDLNNENQRRIIVQKIKK